LKADFCPTLASFGPVCPGIALLLVHCLAARPLLPAYDLGDGAKPQENRQSMLVAFLHQLWQDGAAMNESEKQFSFTRAASSTSGRESPNPYQGHFQPSCMAHSDTSDRLQSRTPFIIAPAPLRAIFLCERIFQSRCEGREEKAAFQFAPHWGCNRGHRSPCNGGHDRSLNRRRQHNRQLDALLVGVRRACRCDFVRPGPHGMGQDDNGMQTTHV
jgi:hypothetical protein